MTGQNMTGQNMTGQNDEQLFADLLSRLSETGLSDAELSALGKLIQSNEKLRSQYLDYCQMHALLRAEHGLLASWGVPDSEPVSATMEKRTWTARQLLVYGCALAATVALVAAGIWYSNFAGARSSLAVDQPRPFRGPAVAKLKKQLRAQFQFGPQGERVPTVDALMPQGTYELESGVIEIEFNSGALVTIEAPAAFTLADGQCVRMENGRMAAHVPKKAIGFRVETASATVVDLGTDFAVEAVTGKNSEVHVFDGEVRINLHGSKTSNARPLHLTTGRAARIDFVTGMPSGIDLDAERFLRRLELQPHAYTRRVLELAPAVFYPMDPAGDGAYLKDAASLGVNATIHFGSSREPVWAPGKVGLAFALGGPAQQTYASVASYPQAEGDQLSVVAWVSAQSRPRWASIAKNWAGSDQWGQFHFGLYNDSGELEAHIQDTSGQEITVIDAVPLPLGVWHHVAFVADGSTLRLYRNGHEVSTAAYHRLLSDPRIRALAIGTKLNLAADAPDHSDFNMWDGRLDELAIFNHALSPQEIRELYELGNVEN